MVLHFYDNVSRLVGKVRSRIPVEGDAKFNTELEQYKSKLYAEITTTLIFDVNVTFRTRIAEI